MCCICPSCTNPRSLSSPRNHLQYFHHSRTWIWRYVWKCSPKKKFGRRRCILRLHKGSSLWSALFEPNWLLWLSAACNKTKNALMPDKAENVALRGRPLGGDTFWPELQKTSETDTRKPRRLPSKQHDLKSSPCPSHHPPRTPALFFYWSERLDRLWNWRASVHSVLRILFFFLKKNKTFS